MGDFATDAQFSTADHPGLSDETAAGTPLRKPQAASAAVPSGRGPAAAGTEVLSTFGSLFVSPPPAPVQDADVALYLAKVRPSICLLCK